MKIFSEIYSTYYNITEKILCREEVTKSYIQEIIMKHGFSETMLFLEPKLTGANGFGLLTYKNGLYRSILKKAPHIPLTVLEKYWLCAILHDKKSGLFLNREQREELLKLLGEEPMFRCNQIRFFDRFSDGDDYENDEYICHFRDILESIHDKKLIKISFNTRKGNRITHYFLPTKIEYSSKNDRFRVYVIQYNKGRPIGNGIINLSQIILTKCTGIVPAEVNIPFCRKEETVVRVSNERNAVNRFMMEFAELERISEYDESAGNCIVKLKYDIKDEAEILIRLLSFGPVVEVISPESFREKVRCRVKKQCELLNSMI